MKVAVPTLDGTSICQHFGRSKSFFVFEVDGGGRNRWSTPLGGGVGW